MGELDKFGLWGHQREALNMIKQYFGEQKKVKADVERLAALVAMPTGTGKSAVIAVAANVLQPKNAEVLVVVPWDALANQLINDLNEKVWAALGVPAYRQKTAVRMLPSTAEGLLGIESSGRESASRDAGSTASSAPRIWVCTAATLSNLYKNKSDVFGRLRERVSAVIVDEGHYEPAQSWAKAVRELRCPCVLLTATPYRNDARRFNADEDFVYVFSHREAQEQGLLRGVEFKEISGETAKSFVENLLEVLKGRRGKAKVIIRCASSDSVRDITSALVLSDQRAIGIHDQFADRKKRAVHLRSTVPTAFDPEIKFWVHQNKLTEGIDDADFRVLAIFEPFQSERALVQQIGRVIRHPDGDQYSTALVVSRIGLETERSWQAYLSSDSNALVLSFRPSYFGGRFRTEFRMSQVTADELRFPRRTYVARLEARDPVTIRNELAAELADVGTQYVDVPTDKPGVWVLAYSRMSMSPFLPRSAFEEWQFGLFVLVARGDLLFLIDSRGWAPDSFRRLPRVPTDQLRRLFAKDSDLTEVTLANLDIGPSSIRRRTTHAASLAAIAPDLSEFAQLPTSVRGRAAREDSKMRYVGFSRDRITESGLASLDDLVTWIDGLTGDLGGSGDVAAIFERWSRPVDAPANPLPQSILLDLGNHEFSQDGVLLKIDDMAASVAQPDFEFSVESNLGHLTARVKWDEDRKRFWIRSVGAASAGSPTFDTLTDDTGTETLTDFLNRRQAFRLVAQEASHSFFYVRGTFTEPNLPIRNATGRGSSSQQRSIAVLSVLQPIAELATMSMEKGDRETATADGWDSNSLFGLIDDACKGKRRAASKTDFDLSELIEEPELVVCDDGNKEIADFLILDKKRVIQVHAKAASGDTPQRLSAGQLHVVGQQAVKNLAYLHPFPVRKPSNRRQWPKGWHDNEIGTVDHRIRTPEARHLKGDAAWKRFEDALSNPFYSRHVWIILGNGLSKSALRDAALSGNRAETIQALYILQSLWVATSAIGAQLTVFCAP